MSTQRFRSLAVLLLMAIFASLMVGCGGKTATPAATEAAASPSNKPLVLTDDVGHQVSFDASPQRIVVAGRATFIVANTLLMFPEGRERLITVESRGVQNMAFYSLVAPNIDQEKFLEVDSGPEQIAVFNPDVVLLKSYMAEKLGQPLEQVGIPYVALDLETVDHFKKDVRLLGQLLGDEARAEEIITFYQEKLDALAQRRGEETSKPRVLVISYSDKGGEVAFKVPPATWIQTTETELAGGEPVWSKDVPGGGWNVVNFEQIAAWKPEIVFVIAYKQDSGEIAARLRADEGWQSLPAGQSGAIYGFPADYYSWDASDPHWLLGVTWMSKKTHPEIYGDLDILQAVRDFYTTLYGFSEQQVNEQIIPHLTGDVE